MSNLYYKGDIVFLYVKFSDINNKLIKADDVSVRILHDNLGSVYEDLPWTEMTKINDYEFSFNYKLPYDCDFGQYQIIYSGFDNDCEISCTDTFYVINESEKYENTIKLYGYISDIRTNSNLSDVTIKIINNNTGEFITQSISNEIGYWESYVYPDEYDFIFCKNGYEDMQIRAQIGDEHNEMQFNPIGLDKISNQQKGNGIYQIKDSYSNKYGLPLSNLNVKIYDIFDLESIVAETITDNNGEWDCFLNPGTYLMKVNGNAFSKEFDKSFSIKIDDVGNNVIKLLNKNIVSYQNNKINRGNGSIKFSDCILDKNGNAIIDVKISAFRLGQNNDESNIIAQDYSDVSGKWELNLDPGNYTIEFYHPNFKLTTNDIEVK